MFPNKRHVMRIFTFFRLLIISLFIVGCTLGQGQPLITENVIAITAPAGNTKPLVSGWELRDTLLIINDDLSLTILGVQISGSSTKIFYSLVGIDTIQFMEEHIIEIVDNNGRVAEIINALPLTEPEAYKLGIMKFNARLLGATELFLQIRETGEESVTHKLLFCKFDRPSSEDRFDLTYKIRTEGGIRQADYMIEMNFWLSPSDKLQADPSLFGESTGSLLRITPTPLVQGIPWVVLSQGIFVEDEISYSVEDDISKEVVYLGVQLLNDGRAITLFRGNLMVLLPIQVVTLAPTSLPYP